LYLLLLLLLLEIMGHVRDFLLKKMCDDFLELFKPLTKSTMTKNEFLIVFYNFLLESEI